MLLGGGAARVEALDVAAFGLSGDERDALVALDRETLRDRFGINPMLLYQLENRVSSAS